MGCGCGGSTWQPPAVPAPPQQDAAQKPQGPNSPNYFWTGPLRPLEKK